MNAISDGLQNKMENLTQPPGRRQPLSSYSFNLAQAIQEHVENLRRLHQGVQICVEVAAGFDRIASHVTLPLYEIVEGAVDYALKDEETTGIRICLFEAHTQIALDIEIDGAQFRLPGNGEVFEPARLENSCSVIRRLAHIDGELYLWPMAQQVLLLEIRVERPRLL